MKTFLKSLLVLSTPVLFLMGLASPSIAQEMKEAPLVDGLADLRKLSKKLVALSAPSAAATVSLVSTGPGEPVVGLS